jgi:tRNA A37 threonylcarbamoyladenosine synthetase subunit TsaC/SUA5/YrdC
MVNRTLDVSQAQILLQASEIVGVPTETVYGLAGNAYSEVAVAKIFEAKNRPTFDPLIVHVASHEMLEEVVDQQLEVLVFKIIFQALTPTTLEVEVVVMVKLEGQEEEVTVVKEIQVHQ